MLKRTPLLVSIIGRICENFKVTGVPWDSIKYENIPVFSLISFGWLVEHERQLDTAVFF
jgi:hypothetical protein